MVAGLVKEMRKWRQSYGGPEPTVTPRQLSNVVIDSARDENHRPSKHE